MPAKHRIKAVAEGSIACELDIVPGDFLLRANNREIADVFDWRFVEADEEILLEIEKASGGIWELEIEKDEDEGLGLEFDEPLMSPMRNCENACIFCFMDQQPRGLRPSLYEKDDDIRLSFLHGNYVTLTNVDEKEARRIAGYHLSPLRISVHTMDMALRKEMMRNENAGKLIDLLRIFSEAGIEMHFQAVLCPGINDGGKLDETIEMLSKIKGAGSLAIVPVGITKYRDGLYPLRIFTREEARDVIRRVEEWAEGTGNPYHGTKFAFLADEWYLLAGLPLPEYEYYEDFPQLDNGVGLLKFFEGKLFSKKVPLQGLKSAIITGTAAAPFLREKFPDFTVIPVENTFFGPHITVSGLLTGGDIIRALQGTDYDVVYLPPNAFRKDEEVMLDGVTLQEIRDKLGIDVQIGCME